VAITELEEEMRIEVDKEIMNKRNTRISQKYIMMQENNLDEAKFEID
jgi:hypothetical protein